MLHDAHHLLLEVTLRSPQPEKASSCETLFAARVRVRVKRYTEVYDRLRLAVDEGNPVSSQGQTVHARLECKEPAIVFRWVGQAD